MIQFSKSKGIVIGLENFRLQYLNLKTHPPKEMDVIDHGNSQNQQKEDTHTHNIFGPMTKFVSRQNENVRVAEDFLIDKDVRVKHSDRGSQSMKGPMEVPVEEISSSRHSGSTCKALSHGRAILCYPVRDVRRVKCDERGSNVILMLCMCRGYKCSCESIRM